MSHANFKMFQISLFYQFQSAKCNQSELIQIGFKASALCYKAGVLIEKYSFQYFRSFLSLCIKSMLRYWADYWSRKRRVLKKEASFSWSAINPQVCAKHATSIFPEPYYVHFIEIDVTKINN